MKAHINEEALDDESQRRNQSPTQLTKAQILETKAREAFFRGCIECLLLERKDRTTFSGQNKLNETLNKLLLNYTELSKLLLLKRVNEISARMSMITLKPGQTLDLDEPSLYIVLDGALRVATHQDLKEEQEELKRRGGRGSLNITGRSTHAVGGGKFNKFKAAASTLMTFRKLGMHGKSENLNATQTEDSSYITGSIS